MSKIFNIFAGLYFFLLAIDYLFLLQTNIPFSPSYIPLTILIGLLLINIRQLKVYKSIPLYLIVAFVIFIYAFVSLLWGTNAEQGFSVLLRISSYLIILIVLVIMFQNFSVKLKPLLLSYYLGVLLAGLYSFYHVGFSMTRFSLLGGLNPTEYAARILWALVVSYILFKSWRHGGSFLLLFGNAILIFFLFMTQGRNAILTLLLSLIIAFLFYMIRSQKNVIQFSHKKQILGSIIIIGLISFLLFYYTGIFEELDNVAAISELLSGDIDQADRATASRISIWQNYLSMDLNHPLNAIFGHGTTGGRFNYLQNYGSYTAPHNVFVLIFFDYGILGLTLFIIFIVALFREFRRHTMFVFPLVWMALALILLGFGNDTFHYKYWWTGLFLFSCMVMNGYKLKHSKGVNVE